MTSANISAFEDATGNPGNWSATAYAICAASAELRANTGIRQELIASARAVDCASGRLAAGAGVETAGGAGRVAVFDVIAGHPGPDAAYAGAHTISNQSADSWNISAQAICATPFPNQAPTSDAGVNDSQAETVTCPAGLRAPTRHGSSAPGSDEFAQTTATCPSGKHLIGTGGEVVGGAGQVVLDDLRADSARRRQRSPGSRITPAWTPTAA